MKTFLTLFLVMILFNPVSILDAQTYHLITSLQTAGGETSSSATYSMFNTLGQATAGKDSGVGFVSGSGFWESYEAMLGYFTPNIVVNDGWNILSVSPLVTDFSVSNLYPSAISGAFSYNPGAGYVFRDTVENGIGFWLKFLGGDTIAITGTVRTVDTISVEAGWNLIGSISVPLDTGSIISNPPGIRASAYYGYEGGYTSVTTLYAGKGYWVKTSESGNLVFAPPTGSKSAIAPLEKSSAVLDEFIVTEVSGSSRSVFLESMLTRSGEMSELPPVGPEGTFDVRFASQRRIETTSEGEMVILIRSIQYPVTLTWNILNDAYILKDGLTGMLIEPLHISGKGEITITNPAVNRLILSREQDNVNEFALAHNYPNPFNPSTTIKFSILKEGQVNLSVFNILGEKVRELKNEIMKPGHYDVEFDASDLASGVYVYRIKAGDYTDAKKMILLK